MRLNCIFTIMSEFPQYSEQEVINFSVAKQQILFKEARRQRASKYSLLASLITMHELKEASDRRQLIQLVEQMLKPHFITEHHFTKKQVDESWTSLRMR